MAASSTECRRCNQDRHIPKLYSTANNMNPGIAPPQLQVNIHLLFLSFKAGVKYPLLCLRNNCACSGSPHSPNFCRPHAGASPGMRLWVAVYGKQFHRVGRGVLAHRPYAIDPNIYSYLPIIVPYSHFMSCKRQHIYGDFRNASSCKAVFQACWHSPLSS